MADDREDVEYIRRLKAFRAHLIAYFVTGALLVGVNVVATPDTVWFVWPIVGWGGILAIHAAYAMGLFGRRG